MELLKSHRSIRKYSNREIPAAILTDILECGIHSSNTGNMQLYSIIVTRQQEKKFELAPLHFNQQMIIESPVILTICFDINRFNRWCSLNNTVTDLNNLLWLLSGVIDSSILAQNICIAAESKGLGICYLGTTLYNAPEIIEVLNLPKGVIPVNTLTIGYPEVIPDLTDRLPLDAILHHETYNNYTDAQIIDYYKAKEELEFSKQFVSENQKQNLAQVYAEVRYKSADNIFFSDKLRKLLEEQGFL